MALTSRELCAKFGYDYVGSFSEGLAWAQRGSQWFHIGPDGEPAYRERYDYVGSFSEGLAEARWGGESFQIRPDGTRVVQ